MSKHAQAAQRCRTVAVLQKMLGGKWKLELLYYIGVESVCRFGALSRALEGITQSALTKQLRELEQDGFLERRDFHEMPPRVEYSLTPLGRSFMEVMEHMKEWGEKNLAATGLQGEKSSV